MQVRLALVRIFASGPWKAELALDAGLDPLIPVDCSDAVLEPVEIDLVLDGEFYHVVGFRHQSVEPLAPLLGQGQCLQRGTDQAPFLVQAAFFGLCVEKLRIQNVEDKTVLVHFVIEFSQ